MAFSPKFPDAKNSRYTVCDIVKVSTCLTQLMLYSRLFKEQMPPVVALMVKCDNHIREMTRSVTLSQTDTWAYIQTDAGQSDHYNSLC